MPSYHKFTYKIGEIKVEPEGIKFQMGDSSGYSVNGFIARDVNNQDFAINIYEEFIFVGGQSFRRGYFLNKF